MRINIINRLFQRVIYLILALALIIPSITHAQSQIHQGTLTLIGNEELVIDGNEYHQKGNIVLHDNARITVKNGGALYFDQDSDKQYKISMGENSQFAIDNGSIRSNFAHIVLFSDLSRVTLSKATAGDEAFKKPGTIWQTNGGSPVFEATASILDSVYLKYPSDRGGVANASIHIAGGKLRLLQLNFDLNAQANFKGLKQNGTVNLDLQSKDTNLPYNLRLENAFVSTITTIERGKASVTFEDCWISDINPSMGSNIKIVNTQLDKFTSKLDRLYGDVIIDGLKSGQIDSWAIDLRKNGSFTFEAKNSSIKSITIQPSDTHLFIRNSTIKSLRPSKDARVTVENSRLGDIQFVSFIGEITFNKAVIDKLTNISTAPKRVNAFEVKGDVEICTADPVVFGANWGESHLVRAFTVNVLQGGKSAPNISWELLDSKHSLIQYEQTDKQGQLLLSVLFDKTNYKDPFYLKINKTTEIPIRLWTNTPITVDLNTGLIQDAESGCTKSATKPTKTPQAGSSTQEPTTTPPPFIEDSKIQPNGEASDWGDTAPITQLTITDTSNVSDKYSANLYSFADSTYLYLRIDPKFRITSSSKKRYIHSITLSSTDYPKGLTYTLILPMAGSYIKILPAQNGGNLYDQQQTVYTIGSNLTLEAVIPLSLIGNPKSLQASIDVASIDVWIIRGKAFGIPFEGSPVTSSLPVKTATPSHQSTITPTVIKESASSASPAETSQQSSRVMPWIGLLAILAIPGGIAIFMRRKSKRATNKIQ